MKTAIIIPARYSSKRFPGKPLKKILGKEMLIRVIEKCLNAISRKKIFVATDNKKIFNFVKNNKYNALMTPKTCKTGTDRVYLASKQIPAKIFINVQGDEPLVKSSDIKKIIKAKKKFKNHVICGYAPISSKENPNNKNIPKVLLNHKGELMYISRLPIPASKIPNRSFQSFNKQVCIYAFNKRELKMFYSFGKKSKVEKSEDIEMIRFLELNVPIKMIKLSKGSIAVDVISDIKKVEKSLKKNERKN